MATEIASFEVDGLRPSDCVTPAHTDEIGLLLKEASDQGRAISPVGGRSMLDWGAPLKRLDLAIDLKHCASVLDYQAANLTVRAEAGVTLADLNRSLGERSQFLPLDPPFPERATLGGILATNANGPLRLRYGTARDLLLGVRVALADGQIVKGGGQVVKNVAGYDLPKLFIGSFGTLGIIVETTWKLAPLPKHTETLVAPFAQAEGAFSVAQRLLQSPLLPMSAEVVRGGTTMGPTGADEHYMLVVRFGGLESAIQRQMRDLVKWATAAGAAECTRYEDDNSLWAKLGNFVSDNEIVLKIGVLPMRLRETVTEAELAAKRFDVRLDWVSHIGGVLLAAVEGADEQVIGALAALRTVASARAGHLTILRAPRRLRERVDVWGPMQSDRPMMRRLKQELDPKGILNPGRLAGIVEPKET